MLGEIGILTDILAVVFGIPFLLSPRYFGFVHDRIGVVRSLEDIYMSETLQSNFCDPW